MNNVRPLQLTLVQLFDTAIGQLDHGQPRYGDWSVQGFGLLRLYVRKIGRIHVWDSALRYPNVSTVHNHSWDLRSTVAWGVLRNHRFTETASLIFGTPYWKQRLVTGYHTEMLDRPVETALSQRYPTELYTAGETYAQTATWIHRTEAEDGTVTVMERTEDERGEADVYWPIGTEFGTAKPRRATNDEVRTTLERALARLEKA